MADKKTITIAIMDAPYENARSTTALRLIDLAARRSCGCECTRLSQIRVTG